MGEKKTATASTCLYESELKDAELLAKYHGLTVSSLIRVVLIRELKAVERRGLMLELRKSLINIR